VQTVIVVKVQVSGSISRFIVISVSRILAS